MTMPPIQPSHEPAVDMWLDSALRPYLRSTYDQCRKYTRLSGKSPGECDLNLDYFITRIVGSDFDGGTTILQALKEHPHMVLTTQSAGTSLLCKYIGMELSSGKVDRCLKALDGVMPVYIDLASVSDALFQPGLSIKQVITALNEQIVGLVKSSFLTRLSTGKAVVIIDNLDHLDEAHSRVATGWIGEIMASGNRMLVTTRHTQRPVLSGVPVLEVEGNNQDRVILIASCRIQRPRFTEFQQQCKESASLAGLVKHPVLLDMAIEVCQEGIVVPDNELDLAREFLSVAVRTARQAMTAKTVIAEREQKIWLSLVGYNLHSRQVIGKPATASKDDLVKWMQESLGEGDQSKAMANVEAYLECTSIFTKTRNGYAFGAPCLVTYCAAKHIEGHVVSPSFVLSRKTHAGISKKTIAEWAKQPARKDVLDGVMSILKANRSREWVDEFSAAMTGTRPTPSSPGGEVSP